MFQCLYYNIEDIQCIFLSEQNYFQKNLRRVTTLLQANLGRALPLALGRLGFKIFGLVGSGTGKALSLSQAKFSLS